MNRASAVGASLLLVWTFVPAAMAHTTTTSHSGGGAGGKNSAQATSEDELHRLTALLNLTSVQQTKVDVFLKKQDSQVKAIQDKTNLTPAEKQTEITSIRTATMTDIKGVLTPAQLAILKKSGTGADGSSDTGSGGGNGAPDGGGGNGAPDGNGGGNPPASSGDGGDGDTKP